MEFERKDLTAEPWADYELIDSGANRKLERFGEYLLIRPETQALWRPSAPGAWKNARAEFVFEGGKGAWRGRGVPEKWGLSWGAARFTARLTSFKHTGLFPEQEENWRWIEARVRAQSGAAPAQVLNLFGYTGIASIAAAQAGAFVTHVDASKQSNAWAKENAELSGLRAAAGGGIRFITDDALGFVMREGRRAARYDGIVLDPPAFGRGPKGEVWRIEEHLPALLAALGKILKKEAGSFFLLNGYAAGYSPRAFLRAVEDFSPEWRAGSAGAPRGEFGELCIKESASMRCVPSGIYVRLVL